MRARPKQTQLEDLSDAPFLGKLLVLTANVRLDWKVIAWYKHSSLFGLIVWNKEKKSFYNIDIWSNICFKGQEQNTLKAYTYASFVNNRQARKVFQGPKHSSLLCLFVSGEETKLYNIDTKAQCYKTFYLRNLQMFLIR